MPMNILRVLLESLQDSVQILLAQFSLGVLGMALLWYDVLLFLEHIVVNADDQLKLVLWISVYVR